MTKNGEIYTTLGAEEYINNCSNLDFGSRKVGIIDKNRILDAIADPRTIEFSTPNGVVPVLTPIEYADGAGYQVDRCKGLVDAEEDVWYLAYPGEVEEENNIEIQSQVDDLNSGYVFYENRNGTHDVEERVKKLFGKSHKLVDTLLLDTNAENGNQEAAIRLYGLDFPSEAIGRGIVSADEIMLTYEEGLRSGEYDIDPENGTCLIRGSNIDSELAENLWSLYEDRFEYLGENHPISMEDTKAAFMSTLLNENTIVSAYKKDGIPKGFTYFITDINLVDWLNPSFIEDEKRMQIKQNQTVLFYPGIVSKPDDMASLSRRLVTLPARVCHKTGGNYKVIFENTNRSEGYIPRILKLYLDRVADAPLGYPYVIDSTVYKCLYFDRSSE